MIERYSDHAANERTFLAWVRTAIAIMAFGFLVQKFDLFLRLAGGSLIARSLPAGSQIVGNIAGIPHNKLVADCTDEEFERILAINLKSVFYGCQAALRYMIPQGGGNIVNISSGAIDTPAPTLACYGMTKAAVAMLTKTLATEVGRHGVRVNAIAPGMILTNFSRHNFIDESGNVVPEKLEQYHKRAGAMSPLGRAGEAEDVARSFLYLVSDAAAFITGQIERPNGGVSMPW